MLTGEFEYNLLDRGYKRIIGIDEVGRGCFAGPVALGAFVFEPTTTVHPDVNDSKLVPAKKRQLLAKQLIANQHQVLLGSVESINEVGIGKAITKLVWQILEQFDDGETYFLLDGRFADKFHDRVLQIIKGDSAHYSIAAASILAKVHRDKLMTRYHQDFPQYNFKQNKGYGTKSHREVLELHGPCELHRKSFAPIRNMIDAIPDRISFL